MVLHTHTYIYKMKIEMRLHVVAVKYCHCEMTTKQRKRTLNGEYVIRKRKSLLAERLFIMSMQICVEYALSLCMCEGVCKLSRALSHPFPFLEHTRKIFSTKFYYVLDFNVIFFFASFSSATVGCRVYVMHNIFAMRRAKQLKRIVAIHNVISNGIFSMNMLVKWSAAVHCMLAMQILP